MEVKQMEQTTLNYALGVLDRQFEHVLTYKTEEQRAYYDGMKTMFNIIVSGAYKTNAHAKYFSNGIHYIVDE
jgi:hypothetical protein